METSNECLSRYRVRSPRILAVALLSLLLNSGCGREFYREWANQDVSEAVFEKSRDPRWRLDLFTIEPPAMSRFADPYDPDRPPAPPDDYPTQAMSPVPQWPDNRLLLPIEGTGYLDMLSAWQRERPDPPKKPEKPKTGEGSANGAAGTKPAATPPPLPPEEGTPSPFSTPNSDTPSGASPPPETVAPDSSTNSGTTRRGISPISLGAHSAGKNGQDSSLLTRARDAKTSGQSGTTLKTNPPKASESSMLATESTPASGFLTDVTAQVGASKSSMSPTVDTSVQGAAFQDTGLPTPTSPPASPIQPAGTPTRDIPTPPIGMDPDPINTDLSAPVNARPDLSADESKKAESKASELAGILVPGAIDFNEAEAAGLPRDFKPFVVSMEQAFTLTLINSRNYQSQLENLYGSSLAVTLQRFAFMPQFYAGMSPLTGILQGGSQGPGLGISPNFGNSFTYATKETGTQISALNLGTVAGVGKTLSTGGRILAGFANQVVFNFVGKNSIQPKVQSFLPLSFVQPFLRGGGRAVTLELLTQAERNLVYAVRSFAKFRQEFIVSTLTGGTIPNLGSALPSQGFSGGGSGDPVIGFLNVAEDIQLVENARRNVAAYDQIVQVYTALIDGESSGLSQLQLDQVSQQLQNARQTLVATRTSYRSDLDGFKMQMGLPPDTPLVVDRSVVKRFREIYEKVDRWQADPTRSMGQLPSFANALPQLEDVVLDGRSLLNVYKEGKNNEDELESTLLAFERVALEHRLDLMNSRAALYDTWRQIKVTANALQGYLNIAVTNQFITPPTNTNPFGFVDQAKQFSVVLNAELPLVRMTERNNFRTALINYQRQRRTLQQAEDTIKLNLRNDIRTFHQQYLFYEIARRNFVLLIRQKDQAFEQIIAPPAGSGTGATSQGAVQTNNLIQAQGGLIQTENTLITTWYFFQLARLSLYRDLGTLPYDEWEAFSELFPSEYHGPGASTTVDGSGNPRTTTIGLETPEEVIQR